MKQRTEHNGYRNAMGRRLQRNAVSVIVALALVFVMVVTAACAGYSYISMRSDLDNRVKTSVEFLSNCMDQDSASFYLSCVNYAETFRDRNGLELQFINSDGQLVASSYGIGTQLSPETEEIAIAMQTRKEEFFLGKDFITDERIMAVSCPVIYSNGEVIGVLRFAGNMRFVDRQILLMAVCALLFSLVFVIAVLLFTKYYIRSVRMPLEDITSKAKRIAAGSYGIQIQTKYNGEIGELADTINDLSMQINQNEKTQTEFISSLSHELRTPLTAITGWSETLLSDDKMDSEEVRRGMSIILREARRLTEMVVDLLDFTRIQADRMTLNIETADIRGEFEDTVYMYGSRMKQEGIAMNYIDTDEDIPEIPCDPKRMKQVFLNILDNAAKHGGSGKRIDASIGLTDAFVEIRIRDFGPGIPEDEIPLVKKKFYKGSTTVRGSGIGLAVCDEIIAMHGGSLTLENAAGGGTMVTVKLPLVQ